MLVSAISFAAFLEAVSIIYPASVPSKLTVFLGLPGSIVGLFLLEMTNGWMNVYLLASIAINAVLYYCFFRLTAKAWKELWEH